MINKFHMNPWIYLGLIPISFGIQVALSYLIAGVDYLTTLQQIIILLILFIIMLCLLIYLYINNIIGLPDLLLLVLVNLLLFNPTVVLGFGNYILLPIAFILSMFLKK